jgi:hypothetical protein
VITIRGLHNKQMLLPGAHILKELVGFRGWRDHRTLTLSVAGEAVARSRFAIR